MRAVGDLELTPGFTAYRSHLEVQTYDVGPLLREGANTVEAVLSDGWYRGQVGFTREHDSYGRRVALLLQIEVALADGSEIVVATDADWVSSPSGIVADLIEGQREDHRVTPGRWAPVDVVDRDLGRLTSSPAPPTRRIEELEPVAITEVGVDGRRGRLRPEQQRLGPPRGPGPGRDDDPPHPRRARPARRHGRHGPPEAVRLRVA